MQWLVHSDHNHEVSGSIPRESGSGRVVAFHLCPYLPSSEWELGVSQGFCPFWDWVDVKVPSLFGDEHYDLTACSIRVSLLGEEADTCDVDSW